MRYKFVRKSEWPCWTWMLAAILHASVAVAQDAPRTELGTLLFEHHDGAFVRLEDVKLRERVAYPQSSVLGALKTPAGAYRAYLSALTAVEEEAGIKTLLVTT